MAVGNFLSDDIDHEFGYLQDRCENQTNPNCLPYYCINSVSKPLSNTKDKIEWDPNLDHAISVLIT